MEKVIKLLMFSLSVSLVTGCATTSEIEKLQSQVDGLNASVRQASVDAVNAQGTAAEAAVKAEAAEAAANRAAKNSQDANRKLNKKFKRSLDKKLKSSMMK